MPTALLLALHSALLWRASIAYVVPNQRAGEAWPLTPNLRTGSGQPSTTQPNNEKTAAVSESAVAGAQAPGPVEAIFADAAARRLLESGAGLGAAAQSAPAFSVGGSAGQLLWSSPEQQTTPTFNTAAMPAQLIGHDAAARSAQATAAHANGSNFPLVAASI
eukprot:6207779-Pleurochrysis_carterae.AAC.4